MYMIQHPHRSATSQLSAEPERQTETFTIYLSPDEVDCLEQEALRQGTTADAVFQQACQLELMTRARERRA